MLVSALISLKKNCAPLWQVVEWCNGILFHLLHPSIETTAASVLQAYDALPCRFSLLESCDVDALKAFLDNQPDYALTHFHPHAFDMATLARLQRNKAFVMMKAVDKCDGTMVGYFFLRCFFIGRTFHGLIVDAAAHGHGIGTAMWMLASTICSKERLRMFATISPNNQASYSSCKRATDINVVEHLANGYLLVECKEKNG